MPSLVGSEMCIRDRVWSDRQGSRRIAIPGLSHLLHHAEDGPILLNDFEWALLTTGGVVPTVEHLAAIPGALGAALLELPLRDGGYLLPTCLLYTSDAADDLLCV